MQIQQDRLFLDDGTPCPFKESPNHAGPLVPELLVLHFTAGRSAQHSVAWLANPRARASAHLVIAEDGAITQLVPFNRVAWHAGKSSFNGRAQVNQFSIGIELANPGNLHQTGSTWRTWFGEPVDSESVLAAAHKQGGPVQGWKIFTPAQLEAAIDVGALLVQTYRLKEVVGHDDIAPGRKVDPGPAFPMARYRGLVLGRADELVA